MNKTTTMIVAGILLLGNTAKAYDYGHTIGRNKNRISHNLGYSKLERKHAIKLDKAKRDLDDSIGDYYKAHTRMTRAQRKVEDLENSRPRHRAYKGDWSYGSTDISWEQVK